ncbi:hypothetical protein C0992_010376 [Termitomyces sp. T32_za158]|nr:hypothetical protein C0992_010376 [Termitomyces sp. T32_za158]
MEVASDGFMETLIVAKESSDWNPLLKAVLGGLVALVDLGKQVGSNWKEMDMVLRRMNDLYPVVKKLTEHLHGNLANFGETTYLIRCATTLKDGCNKILELQSHNLIRRGLQVTSDASTIIDVYKEINTALDDLKLTESLEH